MIKYDNSSVTDGKHSSSGNVNNYPATGYVITKYVHDDDAFSSPGGILMENFSLSSVMLKSCWLIAKHSIIFRAVIPSN